MEGLGRLKLVRCNGRELTVRDVGPPLYRVRARAGGPPIKLAVVDDDIVDDSEARRILEELRASGLYDTENLVR